MWSTTNTYTCSGRRVEFSFLFIMFDEGKNKRRLNFYLAFLMALNLNGKCLIKEIFLVVFYRNFIACLRIQIKFFSAQTMTSRTTKKVNRHRIEYFIAFLPHQSSHVLGTFTISYCSKWRKRKPISEKHHHLFLFANSVKDKRICRCMNGNGKAMFCSFLSLIKGKSIYKQMEVKIYFVH